MLRAFDGVRLIFVLFDLGIFAGGGLGGRHIHRIPGEPLFPSMRAMRIPGSRFAAIAHNNM